MINQKKPIYVIGHRNPDTDSICSAIAYAHLKQALGENAVAVRAGKINSETKYVLETCGFAVPKLIADLYPRVKDVMAGSQITIAPDDTLRDLGNIMQEYDVKSVPVVDKEGTLVGIVTVGDLAKLYYEELEMQDLTRAGVDFAMMLKVLDGTLVCGTELHRKVTGKVRIAAGSTTTINKIIHENDVVLVADRHNAQLASLARNIACLVVTSDAEVARELIDIAAAKGIVVIKAPYDTYTCARLLNQSVPVRVVMKSNVLSFKPSDLISDIREEITSTRYRNYPVVDNGKLVGLINRDQLINPDREKVILVDHNERTQAVDGIEEAQIVEIIDHHRLGGLETNEPIFIRHEPVGCTGTIVASMHWHRDVEIPKDLAALLLSAIVSDTVLFKSPTATAQDRNTAEKLAQIAGIDLLNFGMAVLKAGSSIQGMSPSDIVRNDFKEFQVGESHVAVGQISVMDTTEVLAIKDEILQEMENIVNKGNDDLVLLMVTDIINESTYLIYYGKSVGLIYQAFGRGEHDGVIYLPGVMSRKKQVIPPLMEAARDN
ncbi:Cobalt-dependent inorganic pyrophosphatase [bioreactor metagenome]|uniref:inorganic diphosphatase n=1 Tax=bioreactor metagenome TaxID=1076179 RepID=A0A644TGL7_9ZZZZ|nr:putative manganese-dependent inorganic diphosphatase [Negativicutes bacterium]